MVILLIAIALTTAGGGRRNMFDCAEPPPPAGSLRAATAVFSGKVIGFEYVTDNDETTPGQFIQRMTVRIAVERVWKGHLDSNESLYTSQVFLPNGQTSFSAEDFHFQDQKEYLVYAFGKPDHLSTSQCTRTRELSKAGSDLKELGLGHKTTAPK
jgi:hypothetical protein